MQPIAAQEKENPETLSLIQGELDALFYIRNSQIDGHIKGIVNKAAATGKLHSGGTLVLICEFFVQELSARRESFLTALKKAYEHSNETVSSDEKSSIKAYCNSRLQKEYDVLAQRMAQAIPNGNYPQNALNEIFNRFQENFAAQQQLLEALINTWSHNMNSKSKSSPHTIQVGAVKGNLAINTAENGISQAGNANIAPKSLGLLGSIIKAITWIKSFL